MNDGIVSLDVSASDAKLIYMLRSDHGAGRIMIMRTYFNTRRKHEACGCRYRSCVITSFKWVLSTDRYNLLLQLLYLGSGFLVFCVFSV